MLRFKGMQGRQFLFKPLSALEFEEAIELMTKSFMETNSLWMKLSISHEDALHYNTSRMQKGL